VDTLEQRLRAGTARVGVLGLGYAGLPMAVALARAGYPVVGYDIDAVRVAQVRDGQSPVSNVSGPALEALVRAGQLEATTDPAALATLDAAIICVPTPLTPTRQPDLSAVVAASETLGTRLHRDMLVALQSTSYPGTTRTVVLPRLAQSGLRVGEDFCLVFAPERIDPGNPVYGVENTPKLVGGITPRCTALGTLLFERFIERVVAVSSPEVAEMAKLVENTFRFINISFANEMALLCDRSGLNVWEVIDAAATKPFAFLPHYPGPGVGGHCIPVVPFYLEALARQHGMVAELVEVAGRINAAMPEFVVERLARLLDPTAAEAPRVLAVGVTYKADIADLRESAALRVLERLLARGWSVEYHDPLVPRVMVSGRVLESQPLALAGEVDAVVLLTPHSSLDYRLLLDRAPLVLDTTNALRHHPPGAARVVPL
jgi:UDP-N-acetyl-D-glucosamine dehydrogenase